MRPYHRHIIIVLLFSIIALRAFVQTGPEPNRVNAQQPGGLVFEKFTVVKDQSRLNFSWTVNNQQDCRYFEIEQSTNDKDFKVIAVAFPFENNQDSIYRYYEKIKPARLNTKISYRIRAVINDFTVVYSGIANPLENFHNSVTKR